MTAAEVVKALGGPTKVGKKIGKSPQAVSNACAKGELWPDLHLVMHRDLEVLGYDAPPSVWGVREPERTQ